jgi:hypothetical protein
VGGSDVQEVDRQIVDGGSKLGKRVQIALAGRPVVVLGPIPAQLLDFRQGNALAPVADGRRLRPSGAPEAALQLGQLRRREIDLETLHGVNGAINHAINVAPGQGNGRIQVGGRPRSATS